MEIKFTFKVNVYYLPYLINGDADSLSDEELSMLEQFERDIVDEIKTRPIYDYSEESYFAVCDICRLLSDVVDLNVHA